MEVLGITMHRNQKMKESTQGKEGNGTVSNQIEDHLDTAGVGTRDPIWPRPQLVSAHIYKCGVIKSLVWSRKFLVWV